MTDASVTDDRVAPLSVSPPASGPTHGSRPASIGLSAANTNARPVPLQSASTLLRRRLIMLALVVGTVGALVALLTRVLSFDGLSPLDFVIIFCFAITAPWNVIGFWNAVFGLVLLHMSQRGLELAAPHVAADDPTRPITSKTAILMAIRHEDVGPVFARLQVMKEQLDATPFGDLFEFHVLSDSAKPEIIQAEKAAVAAWRATTSDAHRIHYRVRRENKGFKAGNIREFCERERDNYTFMLTLDADSLMAADDVLKLVRIGERHPEVGLLQSLVVGLPSNRFFTRVFQFGMRHGMRTYTTGSAWWQGDCGPYWGHNALIRLAPFTDHCHLPVLKGKPPLGGYVLSHDQIEAAMMRRAGYECRVVPVEGRSYEENPPTLPDFNGRDLRWCQGNMQYLRMLDMPGLLPTSRIQVLLAILMYFGSAGWMAFILASGLMAHQQLLPTWLTASVIGTGTGTGFLTGLSIWMFIGVFAMSIAPKIAGLVDVLIHRPLRQSYGGTWNVLRSFALEFFMSLLLAPAVAVSVTMFMVGLVFGKRVVWSAQQRSGHTISWATALQTYWPHTLIGLALMVVFVTADPIFAAFGTPIILSLVFAPAFAVVTSSDWLSAWCTRRGICSIPEEANLPGIITEMQDVITNATVDLKKAA